MSKRMGRTYWALDGAVFGESEAVEIGAGHLKIQEGDHVLWFKRRPELTFYGHGAVGEVERRPVEGVDDRVTLRITLEGEGVLFEEPRILSDFGFSLQSVYRPGKPAVHFRRRYRYLPREDFTAVVVGNVDMAATLVGIFLLEMPPSTKAAFTAYLLESGHGLTEEVSLAALWKLLDEYAQVELGAARGLLSSVRAASERLDVENLIFEELLLDHGDETTSSFGLKARELDAFAEAYGPIRSVSVDRLVETEDALKKETIAWLTQMTRS